MDWLSHPARWLYFAVQMVLWRRFMQLDMIKLRFTVFDLLCQSVLIGDAGVQFARAECLVHCYLEFSLSFILDSQQTWFV